MFRPLLVLALFLAVVVGIFWYFTRDGGVLAPTGNENVNGSFVANTNQPVTTNTTNTGTIIDQVARARDLQRVNDVRLLQGAITEFYGDRGVYPASFDDLLAEEYMAQLPENPTPGGIAYVYTPIGAEPFRFYTISYQLEVGVEDVAAGDHTANPNGIAQP